MKIKCSLINKHTVTRQTSFSQLKKCLCFNHDAGRKQSEVSSRGPLASFQWLKDAFLSFWLFFNLYTEESSTIWVGLTHYISWQRRRIRRGKPVIRSKDIHFTTRRGSEQRRAKPRFICCELRMWQAATFLTLKSNALYLTCICAVTGVTGLSAKQGSRPRRKHRAGKSLMSELIMSNCTWQSDSQLLGWTQWISVF